MINMVRNHQPVFQSGYAILHSPSSKWVSAFGVVSVLDFGHSNRCVVVSHCFNCISLMAYTVGEASFHMFICHLSIFFTEVCLRFWAHFLTELFIFLLLSFKSSLYILDNSPLSSHVLCKYILPVCGLSSFLDVNFHWAEVFIINKVEIINYFIHGLCL